MLYRKIILMSFLFFGSIVSVGASDQLNIITREQWGADESLRFADAEYWQNMLQSYEEQKNKEYTPEEQKNIDEAKIRKDLMNKILLEDYAQDNTIVEKITHEDNKELAWSIQKTQTVNSIIIHHTTGNYDDMYDAVRRIYKFHTVSRQWGDIGYNYLIGDNGEIFEGRAGGERVVGAHDKWNNRSTVGIAFIGDYSHDEINQQQQESLEKLMTYLVNKYEIDFKAKKTYHKECLSSGCDIPLTSYDLASVIGHRDAGHTSCPGDALYHQIEEIKVNIASKTGQSHIKTQQLYKKLDNYSQEDLLALLVQIDEKLMKDYSPDLGALEKEIIAYTKSKQDNLINKNKTQTKQKIKVKLSYPEKKYIDISDGEKHYKIIKSGNSLLVNGEKSKIFQLKAKQRDYLEITSWSRKPTWDKQGRYNDNKFRGELIVYVKADELIVVNRLPIEDYLKGLGEVSNGDHSQKIETIIISARSYALWYTTKARKFKDQWYDASDDPNVFQKYLGYSLEQRSPLVNKIVDNTRGVVITYENNLIKPWYFSQSNGKTLSFYSYCIKNNSASVCEALKDNYPYLQSVKDNGSIGQSRSGHGVGVSGKGSTHLAQKGWNSQMILQHYLPGTQLNYLPELYVKK